ncbi:MAG: cation transporter [Candidatus Eremiobacteraeota bacterium]|nr:cation transporter [Candidatus Eremiobacteraeota bacterium]
MQSRSVALRAGIRLEVISIGLATLETVFALVIGAGSGSIALVGFGLDSVIEIISSSALIWRFCNDDFAARERVETAALRIVGWCFLALAAYIVIESALTLAGGERPQRTLAGIVVLALSFVAMSILRSAKKKVGCELDSASMHADARQTEFCAYLSLIALAGVGLNEAVGWWWADPVAALAMVPIIIREGLEAARGEACSHG